MLRTQRDVPLSEDELLQKKEASLQNWAKSLIGMLILIPGSYEPISKFISGDDFSNEDLRAIYQLFKSSPPNKNIVETVPSALVAAITQCIDLARPIADGGDLGVRAVVELAARLKMKQLQRTLKGLGEPAQRAADAGDKVTLSALQDQMVDITRQMREVRNIERNY